MHLESVTLYLSAVVFLIGLLLLVFNRQIAERSLREQKMGIGRLFKMEWLFDTKFMIQYARAIFIFIGIINILIAVLLIIWPLAI